MKELVIKITETCSPDEAYALNNDMRTIDEKFKALCVSVKRRKRSLEENRELAKQFFDGAEKLTDNLKSLEDKLKSDPSIGKDKVTVKTQMKHHKELQMSLNLTQQQLNSVVKNGNMLQNKGTTNESVLIDDRGNEVKALWDEISKMLVARQRQLEEALLFHGMFQDAVQALEDWLSNIEPVLATGTAVMGDVDTIKLLIDQHKVCLYLKFALLWKSHYRTSQTLPRCLLASFVADHILFSVASTLLILEHPHTLQFAQILHG